MAEHTPGPWEAIPGGIVCTTDTGQFIAETYGRDGVGDWRSMEQREADARLMAAAPELLGALRELIAIRESDGDEWHGSGLLVDALEDARHAIAMAEGREG